MTVKINVNKIAENSILLILMGSLVAGFVPASVGAYGPVENPVTSSSCMIADEIEPPLGAGSDCSVVDFDDVLLTPRTQETPHIINYAEITWDSGLPDYCRTHVGCWGVWNNSNYATPHSPPNYAYNAYGAINPGFNFATKVNFHGAYFMTTSAPANPSAVRFVGYVSSVLKYHSERLSLSSAPTYLSAEFPGVDRVVVEMQGSGWFAMDDLSYTVAIPATINVDPDALNLKAHVGSWITCYIELPDGYNVTDINAATVLLNNNIPAVMYPKYEFVWNANEYIQDHDGDGIFERMVKFDTVEAISLIISGLDVGRRFSNVTLTVTGEVAGASFEGSDTIKVVSKRLT